MLIIGTLGYCDHCSEAIIVRETSQASVWTHRNTGMLQCERASGEWGTFATPGTGTFGNPADRETARKAINASERLHGYLLDLGWFDEARRVVDICTALESAMR